MEGYRSNQGRAQATRGLTALSLLSLIIVASADRALLNKPSGGALHAVAVGSANYFITNGNGTWTSSTPVNSAWKTTNAYTGASATAAPSTSSLYPMSVGLVDVTFPSRGLGIAVGLAGTVAGAAGSPTILMTIDQGLSWMVVTGVPAYPAAPAAAFTAGTPTIFGYPALGAPDLISVHFASKTVGWAVGGQLGSVTTANPTKTSVGAILMTQNGGTMWASVLTLPAASQLGVQPMPGCLLSVQSDAAGKNVYAVGAPATLATFTPAAPAAPTAVTYAANNFGTILYSANSGLNWVMQTPPALGSAWNYALSSVAVVKGSTAYAVGGNVLTPQTASGNGVILATTNGGFSWTQAVYPQSGSGAAPAFTGVAVNGGKIWVVGFANTAAFYPTPFVTANGVTTPGVSYTVLTSTDGKNFGPATSTFPASFKVTGTSGTPADTNSIYGITWDNAQRGYMYGLVNIMSTNDGGNTWVAETPNSLIVAANDIFSIANVPTTY